MKGKTPNTHDSLIIVSYPEGPPPCNTCALALRNPKDPVLQSPGAMWNPNLVHITKITSKNQGWVAVGKGKTKRVSVPQFPGRLQVGARCPVCSTIYNAILRAIPVHTSSFTCPKCSKAEHLTYGIKKIETTVDSFTFEAEINCDRCSKKRTIKKMLKNILEIIKIDLGPSGITVKKA